MLFFKDSAAGISAEQVEPGLENGIVEFNLHQPSPKLDEIDVETPGNDADTPKNFDTPNLSEEGFSKPVQIESEFSKEEEKEKQPKVEDEKEAPTRPPLVLQGGITYTVPVGTPIKLKLATVPTHPINLFNRDLEGNLYPARLGQQITARTTEDIYVDKNKVIPEGSLLRGEVSRILPPRRVYRPGSLELSFNELTTPDGRTFAFRAEADNFKRSTLKTKAKGFGRIAAYAAGGAIVGAIVAYDICGMHYTIAMHGYNIAGGAAAGALIATGYAIMSKGPKATLEPGDDLNMVIDTNLLMPATAEKEPVNKTAELPELRIKVEKSKIVNDGVGGHFVTIDALLVNDGDSDLSSIDLFLEDTNGSRHPLCSSPEENSQFLFHLESHSEKHVHLSFLTEFPKLKQQLVWVDHESKSTLVRQKIQ